MSRNDEKEHDVALPFFADCIRLFEEALAYKIHSRTRSDGLLSQISTHAIHEGRGSTIVRAPDDVDEMELRTGSAEITISHDEAKSFDLASVEAQISRIADQFSEQQSKIVFQTMDEATKKTGNIRDMEGKKLSNEMLMEAMEMIQEDLSDGPESTSLSLVIHPDSIPRLKKLQEEFDNSPELQDKFKKMKMRKYEQYRDREMDRNLAG